jgi:non-heme chloroperoxidase
VGCAPGSDYLRGNCDPPEMAKIKIPALVVHGDGDASAPIDLTGRKTAQAIPGAVLNVYEAGPHGLFFTHADRRTADIRAFAFG